MPGATALELPELPELPPEGVVVVVVLLLEPHAATASAAERAVITTAIRRGFKVTSPSLDVLLVSAPQFAEVLSGCEPIVVVVCRLSRQPVSKTEVRVNETPLRKCFLELHP